MFSACSDEEAPLDIRGTYDLVDIEGVEFPHLMVRDSTGPSTQRRLFERYLLENMEMTVSLELYNIRTAYRDIDFLDPLHPDTVDQFGLSAGGGPYEYERPTILFESGRRAEVAHDIGRARGSGTSIVLRVEGSLRNPDLSRMPATFVWERVDRNLR